MVYRSTFALASVLAFFAPGCAGHIQVEVLEPAAVTMPPDIKTLGIIDRSAPSGVGEAVLGAIEGLLTGEAILGDREAAAKAMEELTATLARSPRFDAVLPAVTKEQVESDIWDSNLSWKAADRICKKAGCDALVSLEAIDSDSSLEFTQDVVKESQNGQTVNRIVYVAQRDSSILTAWRVYDVKNHVILDELRDHRYANTWEERGDTKEAALNALPNQVASLETLGATAGDEYARRIAPSYRWVSRSYYGRSDDRLKEGKNHVKAQDWDGASEIWLKLAEHESDPKIRGKAYFDLALWRETLGDLDGAHEYAKKAAVDLSNGRSRRYVETLSQRIADQRLLAEQMKVEEEKNKVKPEKTPSERAEGSPSERGEPSGESPSERVH